MRDAQSKNCIGSNIFEVQSYATTVSSLASSAGSCETIILSSNSYLQNPAIPINSFGNINSGSIILRSASFKLYTPALSIVIPPNQSLQVSLDASDKGDTWISSSFKGQKGIVVSPAYNGFLQSVPGTLFSFSPNSCTRNCGINFKVNSTDDQSVTYNDERGNSRFFRQNDNITVHNSYVNLKYAQNSANSSFFITYTIVDSAVEPTPGDGSGASRFQTVTTLVLCFIITIVQN
uniref:Uncharacterized protein n=1 Tax=Panagrolaimus superbus TaxID=310955 RepID=A0A914Y4X8_9BILA